MHMNKIVVNHGMNVTTEEKLLDMKKKMEKAFETGPIIGEAHELIMNLLLNLYQRDLLLDSLDMSLEKREEIFRMTGELMDERDKEILNERK